MCCPACDAFYLHAYKLVDARDLVYNKLDYARNNRDAGEDKLNNFLDGQRDSGSVRSARDEEMGILHGKIMQWRFDVIRFRKEIEDIDYQIDDLLDEARHFEILV